MDIRQRLEEFEYEGMRIPSRMHDSIVDYLEYGRPTGDFLEAILANNLMGAVRTADGQNAKIIPAYVAFLYIHVPGDAWGSPETVQKWRSVHRLPTEPFKPIFKDLT
jgi:hypothetical protein